VLLADDQVHALHFDLAGEKVISQSFRGTNATEGRALFLKPKHSL
jgi:hypothetical protein